MKRSYRLAIVGGILLILFGCCVTAANVAAPVAFFPFSGWKASFLGDLHAHGPDAVDFFTRKKTTTSRYFSGGSTSGSYFVER